MGSGRGKTQRARASTRKKTPARDTVNTMLKRCATVPDGAYLLAGPIGLSAPDPTTGGTKEYQVALFYDDVAKDYPVLCAWGQLGEVLSGQIKGREGDEEEGARLAQEWMDKKLQRGYSPITPQTGTSPFDLQAVRDALGQVYFHKVKPVHAPKGIEDPQSNYQYQKGTPPPPPSCDVVYDATKWSDFLTSGQMDDTPVNEYYRNGSKPETKKEYEQLINDLFLDAVAIGSIQLPKGTESEDFQFSLRRRHSDDPIADTLTVTHTPTAENRSFRLNLQNSFPEDLTMASWQVNEIQKKIGMRAIALMKIPVAKKKRKAAAAA